MLIRQIPVCKNCPYFSFDVQLTMNGVKLNIFDIDLVIEVGKRIEAIAELKRYYNASSYKYFFYYLAEIDRFRKEDPITRNGKKVIRIPREKAIVLTESEFQQFWIDKYG